MDSIFAILLIVGITFLAVEIYSKYKLGNSKTSTKETYLEENHLRDLSNLSEGLRKAIFIVPNFIARTFGETVLGFILIIFGIWLIIKLTFFGFLFFSFAIWLILKLLKIYLN